MIEGIGLAIIKTLSAYLFKTYVLTYSKINIEGAPSWYMKNVPAQVCVYTHEYGSLSAIDTAKDKAQSKMQGELSGILESVIYSNFSNLKDEKEKKFVFMFKNDPDAPVFIRSNMKFTGIEYNKKVQAAFVRGCIDKDVIIAYQDKRVQTIKYELTHKRADDAFDEMEKSTQSPE